MDKKKSFNYEDLIASSKGELFGKGFGRMPAPNMLMLDRIVHVSKSGGNYNKGEIIAELDINPDLWFFDCHFIDDPVMPGCLGLDALWQLLGFYLTWLGYRGYGRALGVNKLRFKGEVSPSENKVVYHVHIKRIIERTITMGIADGTLSINGNEIYTAKELQVGIFKK